MQRLKHYTFGGILFVLAAGTLLHFLYKWTNYNWIAGLFSPVNESVWEHMKLLFFPMLLYSSIILFQRKEDSPCAKSALCFGILIGTICIPLFFYAYTSVLGRNYLLFDLATFAISTIIAFVIAYKFTLSCKLQPYTFFLCGLVCVFFLCFVIFSYCPPDLPIFSEP